MTTMTARDARPNPILRPAPAAAAAFVPEADS